MEIFLLSLFVLGLLYTFKVAFKSNKELESDRKEYKKKSVVEASNDRNSHNSQGRNDQSYGTIDDLSERFVSLDIETTGLKADKHQIIEIGAVRFVGGKPIDDFQELIKPTCKMSPMARKVHRIKDSELKDARNFEEVIAAFAQWLGDDRLIAHNADFEMSFFREHETTTQIWKQITHCTLSYSREILQDSILGERGFKLSKFADYLNVELKNAHRALPDAMACGQVAVMLAQITPKDFKLRDVAYRKLEDQRLKEEEERRAIDIEFLNKCRTTLKNGFVTIEGANDLNRWMSEHKHFLTRKTDATMIRKFNEALQSQSLSEKEKKALHGLIERMITRLEKKYEATA